MSASVNKVMLMGNLTRDPELKYLPSGSAVADLNVAVNRSWKDKDGKKQDEVSFIEVVSFGRTAELCAQYLKKGRQVFIEGRLKQDRWEDKESGAKRSKTRVVAESVQFLGGGKKDGASAEADEEVEV